MMSIIQTMTIIFMMSFMLSNSPMTKLCWIIMQTMMIGIHLSMIQKTNLWAMIIMIIMLGGMFVMFLYISSLSSKMHPTMNKKMTKWKMPMNMSTIMMMMIISMINSNMFFMEQNQNTNMTKMFSSFYLSTILLSLFLLFVLLIVVIMTSQNNRPMRAK